MDFRSLIVFFLAALILHVRFLPSVVSFFVSFIVRLGRIAGVRFLAQIMEVGMSKPYVSEFANFMDKYLEDHPTIVVQQKRGAHFFWELKFREIAPAKAVKAGTPAAG